MNKIMGKGLIYDFSIINSAQQLNGQILLVQREITKGVGEDACGTLHMLHKRSPDSLSLAVIYTRLRSETIKAVCIVRRKNSLNTHFSIVPDVISKGRS